MEIRCRKCDCSYNTGASCAAAEIEVDKGFHCKTYLKNNLKSDLIIENGNLFEISESLVAKNVKNVPLKCSAKTCLYNKSGCECTANGITIIDGDQVVDTKNNTCCSPNAECATYVEG